MPEDDGVKAWPSIYGSDLTTMRSIPIVRQSDTDASVIEAMARAMRDRASEARDDDEMLLEEIGGWLSADGFRSLARAALAAYRAEQEKA